VVKIDEIRAKLKTSLDYMTEAIRNPRVVSTWLEESSPWLSRRVLGAASNLAEPFVVGMGLDVVQLSEELIEVSLPGSWRNQGEGGAIHAGALSTLGEFTSRLYWEYHLDLRRSDLSFSRLQLRILGSPGNTIRGDLRAIYRISVSEREKLLHRLRAEAKAETEAEISVYDSRGKLVALVEVDWTFVKQLSLGTRAAQTEADSKNKNEDQ
jgi:hypothetical protein